MFVIKRTRGTKTNFWSRDTARNFWYSLPDKKWLKAFASRKAAEKELTQVKANFADNWTYSIISIPYSLAEQQRYKHPPLEGDKVDPDITTI